MPDVTDVVIRLRNKAAAPNVYGFAPAVVAMDLVALLDDYAMVRAALGRAMERMMEKEAAAVELCDWQGQSAYDEALFILREEFGIKEGDA